MRVHFGISLLKRCALLENMHTDDVFQWHDIVEQNVCCFLPNSFKLFLLKKQIDFIFCASVPDL